MWYIQPLKDTVHGAPWSDLKNKKLIVVRDTVNVDSNLYWRKSYVVLCTVFPELLALRLVNSNKTNIDKIYYYDQKDNLAIDKNADYLNNPLLFTIPGKEDGENGYECLESSTKDYDVNEDVGPVDDLDDYENFSNIERYDDSKDGNLSPKQLD